MPDIKTPEEANDFRTRVLKHEPLTDDEIASAIAWLRQERLNAKPKKATKEKADKPEKVTLEELDSL